MMLRRLLWVLVMSMTLTACNLGNASPTSQPLINTPSLPTSAANVPVVSVESPQDGSQFTVNQPVLVRATGSSSQGVTRIQLFANGSPVKTVSSVSPLGDTTLTATLDYTPRAVGPVSLRVLAFRGAISSAPVDLQVNIVSQAIQPTSIPLPNSGGGNSGGSTVVIPPDGVCRVLTNTAVNFRSAPTTQQNNILNTLGASTLLPVIARNSDNSWWKVAVNAQVGWVFGQIVTITGNCFNIPIEAGVTPTPPPQPSPAPTLTPPPTVYIPAATVIPAKPDLVVVTIFGETELTLSGGTVTQTYSVTISNVGQGSAGQFSATIQIGNGLPMDLGTVSGLDRGQSVVLERALTFSGPGTYNIRVDVDPANQVPETSDVNNRGDVTVTVTN